MGVFCVLVVVLFLSVWVGVYRRARMVCIVWCLVGVFCVVIKCGCVFGCRHKRRFVPLPLSVRYALGCNFLF